MPGFDIIVTETTTVELEVDLTYMQQQQQYDMLIKDLKIVNTYYSDSEEEYGTETTRTFHENVDEKYLFPIDKVRVVLCSEEEEEENSLKLLVVSLNTKDWVYHQHEMLKASLDDQIFLAPIKPDEIKHVLDIGSGHGKWAVDFASEHPNTQVIGTDLSLPTRESVPENCKFVIADAEEPWQFPHKFDFIILRDLMMCFSDQKEVFRSAFDALEPGGYCEILDAKLPLNSIDDSMEGSAVAQWFQACVEAGESGGRPWTNIPKYREWMDDIGFEEVTETVYDAPINDWPIGVKEKKVGAMMQKDMKEFLYSTKRLIVEGLKWDEAVVSKLLNEAKKSGKDRNVHAYVPIYVVWGRKPSK
ncbi:hypothetical protein SBOR_7531 [Sclerotinia borealis F-4128]|uniref:Methyltransferase domain-containing protein n=1 Tax=Sclerotinia borealis (strain F-4128) TaxID=1432307 RepID=W9CB38_SCLBF|nr:hypothetical protein SBOR_7531 [Sclerotinia borealis F-4128]